MNFRWSLMPEDGPRPVNENGCVCMPIYHILRRHAFYQWGSGNKDTPVNAFSTGMKKEVQATKLETTSVLWPTTSCRRHRKNPSTCIDHDDQEKCDPKEQVAY
jgi:hypothetical protein